jgi:putative flippase GtrA
MHRILQHPRLRRHFSQGWRFGVVGATGAVVDLGVLSTLVSRLMWNPIAARMISMSFSLTIVFLCNRAFTFKSRRSGTVVSQIKRFLLAYASGIILNFALYTSFLWLGLHYSLAGVLSIIVGAAWNYTLSHRFIFAT